MFLSVRSFLVLERGSHTKIASSTLFAQTMQVSLQADGLQICPYEEPMGFFGRCSVLEREGDREREERKRERHVCFHATVFTCHFYCADAAHIWQIVLNSFRLREALGELQMSVRTAEENFYFGVEECAALANVLCSYFFGLPFILSCTRKPQCREESPKQLKLTGKNIIHMCLTR